MTTTSHETDLRKALGSTMYWGLGIIIAFFGLFGGWLALAPLSSATVATGVVSPDGSRRTVQHLEGGIIKQILVRNGDLVKAGQTLIALEDVQAKAQYTGIKLQWLRLRAIRYRTEALQTVQDALSFPEDIYQQAEADPEFAVFLKAQSELFDTRRSAHEGRKNILQRQMQQIREQLVGLAGEYKGNKEQLSFISEELSALRRLVKSGDAKRSRYLQMQRAKSEVQAKVSATRASISSANQKVSEIEIAIANAETEFREKLADEYMRINGEIAQLEERKGASGDVLKRTAVVATVSGIVVGLRFKSVGGVIRPGDLILELVPSNDRLVIDARIRPIDINAVKVGQRAQVHLLPFEQRHLPIIEGDVVSKSADAMTDERTGERYYEARIVIPNERLKKIAPNIVLTPGMPADVMIVTGERSALQYILEPIQRSFRKSFRQG